MDSGYAPAAVATASECHNSAATPPPSPTRLDSPLSHFTPASQQLEKRSCALSVECGSLAHFVREGNTGGDETQERRNKETAGLGVSLRYHSAE